MFMVFSYFIEEMSHLDLSFLLVNICSAPDSFCKNIINVKKKKRMQDSHCKNLKCRKIFPVSDCNLS
jgi:hypothetical protein